MQFQIPQFIEVEDKIFGPFTFKQFLYFAGAGGFSFIAWRILPIYLSVIMIVGVCGLAAALALFEWNGRPFILALEYGFYYLINTKLYLWSHERKQKKAVEAAKENKPITEVYVPRLSESRLHDLAWSLDIQEKINQLGMRTVEPDAPADTRAAVRTAKEAMVR